MQDKYTFEYAIIRIVPKVEREEFFNVGVILFSKRKNFLGIKYEINKDKLKAFSPEIELDLLNGYLNRRSPGAALLFRRLRSRALPCPAFSHHRQHRLWVQWLRRETWAVSAVPRP